MQVIGKALIALMMALMIEDFRKALMALMMDVIQKAFAQ